MFVAPLDEPGGGVARDERERRLQGLHVADGLASLEQLLVEVADARGAALALGNQAQKLAPGLLDRRPGFFVRPVELKQIDGIHPEPAQRRFAVLPDRRRPVVGSGRRLGAVPTPPALRVDLWPRATNLLERTAHELF